MIESFSGEYRWLSNFWECNIPYGRTTEHAYQAAKFTSEEDRLKILECSTPGKAKVLVRSMKPDNTEFHKNKLLIMRRLQKAKFCKINNPELVKLLLDTNDMYIQEGNHWGDEFWGVNLKTGKGKNNLGIIIMSIREELRGW